MVDLPTAVIVTSSIGIKIQTFSANVTFSLVSRLVKNTLAFLSQFPIAVYRVPVGVYGWIKPMARPATATMNAANPTVCTHKA